MWSCVLIKLPINYTLQLWFGLMIAGQDEPRVIFRKIVGLVIKPLVSLDIHMFTYICNFHLCNFFGIMPMLISLPVKLDLNWIYHCARFFPNLLLLLLFSYVSMAWMMENLFLTGRLDITCIYWLNISKNSWVMCLPNFFYQRFDFWWRWISFKCLPPSIFGAFL